MPVFPLATKVDSSTTVAPRKFDAPRRGGTRKHAGCDLGIGAGSAVFAITGGTVIEASNTGFLV
jgi:ribosomal protein L27